MHGSVSLKIIQGRLAGKTFSFDSRISLIVGRQKDCGIVLPDDKVSRHHCVLDIDPPFVRVQDLSSLNGTYLNHMLIGGQRAAPAHSTGNAEGNPVFDMWDGDLLGVGSHCELLLSSPMHGDLSFHNVDGYERLELLGKGGMGHVWRVRERASGRCCALKTIYVSNQLAEGEREKYLREASYASQLDHPHILRLYHSGENDELVYFLQELCEGGSVQDWMWEQKERPLPFDTATHIILQVLDGLAYAHQARILLPATGREKRGLIHRDIKPGNILLADRSDRPTAKIGDFGLAKIIEMTGMTDPTRPDEFGGSADFISRLQILHFKDAKPEMDVWSAAATYYYMLTGTPPKKLRHADRFKLAAVVKPEPIRRRSAAVPPAMAQVIDDALAETPEMGCKDAGELKARIEAAL